MAKEQAEYLQKYGPKYEENEQSDVKNIPEKGKGIHFTSESK